MTTTTTIDESYLALARDLADALMRFARNRHTDDQKEIGALQHTLCQLRREELAPPPSGK
jgi:hypothetical protein